MKKYAVIRKDVIHLMNKPCFRPAFDVIIEDYKFNSDKTIIEGNEREYILALYKTDVDINDLDPSELIEAKSFFTRKKYLTFNTGWLLLKSRKKIKIENKKGFVIIYREGD